jgi:hypothetical protein
MQNLFSKYGDTQVLFADYVDKINSNHKPQRRAIVVTEKHIYKQDPKNYKVKKFETPLSEVVDISMGSKEDTFVVVHAKEPHRDLVLNLGVTGEEKYSEFVSVIVFQIKRIFDRDLPVEYSGSIIYNTARSPKKPQGSAATLKFEASNDPKLRGSMFKTGKGGVNIVCFTPLGPPGSNSAVRISAEKVKLPNAKAEEDGENKEETKTEKKPEPPKEPKEKPKTEAKDKKEKEQPKEEKKKKPEPPKEPPKEKSKAKEPKDA